VTNGSVFHVSFQLIQGDDVNFYIQDPMGYEIFRLNYDKKGSHQISQVPNDGKCFIKNMLLVNSFKI
jgi:hypothetical protein